MEEGGRWLEVREAEPELEWESRGEGRPRDTKRTSRSSRGEISATDSLPDRSPAPGSGRARDTG